MLTEFLQQRPLLLLFGVTALGYFVGQLGWRGFSLGVAAVLFAGLLVGYAVPGARLPDFVSELGLVLFVYTVGIASGPGFFASLRRKGLRDNAIVLTVLLGCSLLVFFAARACGLSAPVTAGLFAGSLTNTPALAAAIEALKAAGGSGAALSAPVLAYSVCYPLGVLIPLLGVGLGERIFRVKYDTERISLDYGVRSEEALVNASVCIAQAGRAETLRKTAEYTVNFGRFRRGNALGIVHEETEFRPGDLVTVIGTKQDVAAASAALGSPSSEHLDYDRSQVDYRRMFVSNPDVAERPLRELHLTQKHDAVVTRVRRGDVDMAPDDDFELLLGDRVRVVAPKDRMPALEKLFGDSLRRVSEMDAITFGLGIALGLLIGAIPFPSPAGGTFSLGLAGGPLIAGLALGKVGRTGPLVWAPPYGVNMTLRQFGLMLFLAAVGLKAGGALGGVLDAALLPSFALGALLTLFAVSSSLLVGRVLFGIPLGVMAGILAGQHTQPAVLAFAVEKTGRDTPNIGYAAVFPLAMIAKILLAQFLLHAAG